MKIHVVFMDDFLIVCKAQLKEKFSLLLDITILIACVKVQIERRIE